MFGFPVFIWILLLFFSNNTNFKTIGLDRFPSLFAGMQMAIFKPMNLWFTNMFSKNTKSDIVNNKDCLYLLVNSRNQNHYKVGYEPKIMLKVNKLRRDRN
jgi:hypothetical protein